VDATGQLNLSQYVVAHAEIPSYTLNKEFLMQITVRTNKYWNLYFLTTKPFLSMTTTDLKETVSDVKNFASDKLTASLSFLKDAKEAGAERIKGFVNDILGLAPLIEVTGFNMKDVSVDVGIPPGMSISFVKEKDVDTETINQLLEENKDKEMLKLIVRALLKADLLQKGMKLSHYKFNGLNMKIGLPPDISLKFTRNS
jgi:hypothetical protein